MINVTKEEIKLPILKVNGISDIYYEEFSDFDNSIHRTAYKRACEIVREIIGDAQNDANRGTDLRNREQICNIVFFTGEKGTGKTSTMLSFMEFLKDYHRISRKNEKELEEYYLSDDPYMFTGIEYIDASALNDKEDIFGNVLSKMLSKWKNEEERGRYQNSGIVKGTDYEYKRNRMFLQCAELFDRLKAVKRKEDVMDNDSDMFIESIESLSFSWNLKNSFQKLVESYLDIMVYPDSGKEINKENHYLVIPIDDVDMNVQSGFMLLEQIRKYLMVPNVLVLMSANYEQLEKICYNHYLKEFEQIKRYDNGDLYMQKISREYLEKMAPMQRQVELLSNRGWEFFSDKQLQVQYSREKNEKNGLTEKGTLCEIVSRCIQRYFGVWFGVDRKCIYHLAPDTVRETCSWICQIYSLKQCFQEDKCINIENYESNLHWFMLKEFPRLCRKYLGSTDCKVIEMLDILTPARQIELIRDTLRAKMKQNREKSLLKLFARAKEGYEEVQDFASLCLIYFNMKLQQLSVQMRKERNGELDLGETGLLIRYYTIGGWGVWGTWEQDMLAPLMKRDSDQKDKILGFYRIARNSFTKDNGCLNLDLVGTFNGGEKKSIMDYIDKNRESIRNYQYLLLFYRLQDANEEPIDWERGSNGNLKLRQSRAGIFSLSGFVLNLVDKTSLLRKFQDWLWREFSRTIKFSKSEEEEIRKKVFINPKGDLLLPIQNVDFIVSLGSELQRKLGGGAGATMNLESVKQQILSYFNLIADYLRNVDRDFAEKFFSYELVDKIVKGDKNFLTLLSKSAMIIAEELNPVLESEWTGENAYE